MVNSFLTKEDSFSIRLPISVGSYVVHVRSHVTGKRHAIVLVHGIGVSGDYFLKYAEILKRTYDVYILDLPGYGKTPKPKKVLSISALAVLVNDLIKKLSLEKSILIGHSMGCQIVAHSAAMEPTLFHKILLLSPTINKNERHLVIQAYRLLQDTFKESLAVNYIVFSNYLKMGVIRYLATTKYMLSDKIEDSVAAIAIPTLCVVGSKDAVVPVEWVSFLEKQSDFITMQVIDSAPHILQMIAAKELEKITKNFIYS